jgi:rRNA-processing protein FCF1
VRSGGKIGVKVLFDTNFLMSVFEKPVNAVERVEELLETKVRPIILRSQLRELEKIASSEKRHKAARIARAVLEYVKKRGFEVVDDEGEVVDDAIVEASKRGGYIVATNDRELRRRLRESGVSVVYMRSDGKFELEGYQP